MFFFATRANVCGNYLLGLVLHRCVARVGRYLLARTGIGLLCRKCRMDVFVWRARLDIDLYGVGTLDRTAWDTSFRPRSLAEIFVAEPGPFEQFGETVVYSLLLSTWSYFVDSWKLSFPFSRIPETGTLQQLVVSRKKKSGVRSRISSKLISASCVGYFDRAYY